MSKINTNMASVTTLYHLTNKEGSMNKALERISSGLRLNHAVDDAAGASIVNRMTSQIKGLEAAIRNAADAISLTQTAEGSLEEVTQILHRMRELSVQAANGVYTGQDRQAINNEIVAMQNELQRIAESSTFNGVKMLNGDFQDTTFQVGFQPNDTATLSIEDVRPSGLGEYILSTSNIDADTTASSVSEITNRVTTTVTAAETASLTIQSVITNNDNTGGSSNKIDSSDAVDAKLSSALQAFVDLDKDANGFAKGTFAISGTDAASFSVSNTKDATHGVITGTNIDYETKTSYVFDLVYTNSAGEKFHEAVTVKVTNDTVTEVAEKLTFTLTQPFTDLVDGNQITVTDGVTSLVYTTAAGTKDTDDNTTTTNIVNGLKALPGYAAAGYTLTASGKTIVMDLKAPGAFTQANASITSNGTLANSQAETVAGVNTNATATAANADRAASVVKGKLTTLTVEESSQVIINPLNIASPETTGKLSNTFKTFVSSNPAPASQANGGFSLTGADAAKFEITSTGVIKSKAGIDFDVPGSAASSNVYMISVNYTNGSTSIIEDVSLNITDDASDAGYSSAAAQPFLGISKSAVGSLISENEDLTIFGNVGTKVIDINGGSSARDVVTKVNAIQGETGVYAAAQTRINISFPDQAAVISDTVSFKLFGKNSIEQVVSGNVDLGVVGGRDASLRNLANAVNSASGSTGITAKVSTNGSILTLISNDGYDIVMEGYAMSANTVDMNVSAANSEYNSIGVVQAMQEGTANKNSMRISGVVEFHSPYIFSVSTNAIGNNGGGLFQQIPGAARLSSVADLNVLTVANAQRMLTAVDGALVRVDLERSDLGATMSRMEHTIANLSNINLNTKAARSRIQDADIAAETVELNRTQVLSQAAQAMLAQANRTSQSILSLLQG